MDTSPAADQLASDALRILVERGYYEQASDLAAIDAAMAEKMVTFYIGYDPTASSLHAGSLLTIMAMRLLQQHGHRPIVLLGGGTARIGDPSGRSEIRKMMDDTTIDENVAGIHQQLRRFLQFDGDAPNTAMVVDNASWLMGQHYIEFLRDVGVHFTVNRMLATKTYRERLESELPLSFLEFNYQLLQAYDFLHLYRSQHCTLQMGGSDQWGNMIAGVELIRRVMGRDGPPAHCLTFPLLTTADGRKMGKSERGAIWLDPRRLSSFDYYQYWIGCDDRDTKKLLRLFTDLPLPEIDALCQAEGAALRDAKTRLAYEATKILHGADAADQAQVASAQAYGGGDDWSAVPAVDVSTHEIRLVDLVVDPRIAAFKSKRQARQRIESGAVKIDGEVCTDPGRLLTAATAPEGLRLQAGKKTRFRIKLG